MKDAIATNTVFGDLLADLLRSGVLAWSRIGGLDKGEFPHRLAPRLIPLNMFAYPFRLAVFGVFVGVVYTLLHETQLAIGPEIGRENGPIEIAQVLLSLLATLGFSVAAARSRIGKAGLVACGGMLAYAAARESDVWFKTLLFEDAYKYVVGIPVLVFVAYVAYQQRDRIVEETLHLLNQPAGTIFILAGIFLAFVCQTLDRPGMWGSADHTTKAMIEETVELFAYLVFAFSATEAVWFANSTVMNLNVESKPNRIELRIAA